MAKNMGSPSSKVFTIDVSRCSGCFNCQLACKDEHAGNDFLPYAKAQPPTGQFWMKVADHARGTIPKVKIHYVPRLCAHCRDAACMAACPSGAIYRRDDGLVLIDPGKCAGCKACMAACPYEVIYYNEKENLAQKCTGCAHLLDNGYPKPRCVEACPTDALQYRDEAQCADFIAAAQPQPGDEAARPRLYYRGIPGRFIGATVYDPVDKEVVIGARCTLTARNDAAQDGAARETRTDNYGDFWFRDLPEAEFTLEITAEGFRPKRFHSLNTETDLNLGDVPLERA
jgi:Fe-S-cluster-containing dehydrogenase component